jgi:hypothetical protein
MSSMGVPAVETGAAHAELVLRGCAVIELPTSGSKGARKNWDSFKSTTWMARPQLSARRFSPRLIQIKALAGRYAECG